MKIFRFTNHVRERFVERTNSKYQHLRICKQSNCPVCLKQSYEILRRVENDRRNLDEEIRAVINTATEDRSYVNNTEFMSRYYEKYGYDENFLFLQSDKVVFVALQKEGYYLVVTCVPVDWHVVGRSKVKFKKKTILTQ